jgi:hypothetical protein
MAAGLPAMLLENLTVGLENGEIAYDPTNAGR